jgi:hypothetical protein
MDFVSATKDYERWLGKHLTLVPCDLTAKHEAMSKQFFPFFRATYYRWAQTWPEVCVGLNGAPKTLAVGDLHVENFGTWRDTEGRLIWGLNDFDETWPLPYTNDLVRLAASAQITEHLSKGRDTCDAILEGYLEGLKHGGRPYVLAEDHLVLRHMATERLKDPGNFWRKVEAQPEHQGDIPKVVAKGLERMMPERGLPCRYLNRVAGLGSLGRVRIAAVADWHGAKIVREAKALAPSACAWATHKKGTPRIRYEDILETAVRCPDPLVRQQDNWILRRLAPDCSRIELSELPRERDELRLLRAMGWETANVHLGNAKAGPLLKDARSRRGRWLHKAAMAMLERMSVDWEEWRASYAPASGAAAAPSS